MEIKKKIKDYAMRFSRVKFKERNQEKHQVASRFIPRNPKYILAENTRRKSENIQGISARIY